MLEIKCEEALECKRVLTENLQLVVVSESIVQPRERPVVPVCVPALAGHVHHQHHPPLVPGELHLVYSVTTILTASHLTSTPKMSSADKL